MISTIVRISPNISPTANDWFTDKYTMVKRCLESFMVAGGNKTQLLFILDDCPIEYENLIDTYSPSYIRRGKWGTKRATIEVMFELAHDWTAGEVVLFLEDDYLWKNDPTLIDRLESATKCLMLVTPYDHRGHYSDDTAHFIRSFNNELWRKCIVGTHTFAVRKDIFEAKRDQFYYGDHDWQMFYYLYINGLALYSNVTGYCTHLAKGCESYGYDWRSLL